MIEPDVVRRIAALSRLHLGEQETLNVAKELEAILGYIGTLSEVDIRDVQPTSHPLDLKDVFREDEITGSLPQDRTFSIAVDARDSHFQVPKVID